MSTATPEDTSVELKKSDLINTQGISYAEFRRTLTPIYARVWLDVFLGYLSLMACAGAVPLLEIRTSGQWIPILAVAGAFAIGYCVHFLHLFMHEGAHYNLAPDRTWNDRLANIFVGLLVGMHMKPYRPTHFDHHRDLGAPKDTEIAYFDPLNMRFIVESVTGLRILKTLLNRNKSHRIKGIKWYSFLTAFKPPPFAAAWR